MLKILRKTLDSISNDGLARTLGKILRYPLGVLEDRAQTRRRLKAIALRDTEQKFTEIYSRNLWGSDESASGVGSTLECTANLRNALPGLFRTLSVNTVFDAPCGDFNWMRHVVQELEITYIGGDIVRPLLDVNISRYGTNRIRFLHIDLTSAPFPAADLMICRDCMFHLSYQDTWRILRNFVNSEIPYLLATTHINQLAFRNRDIVTGDFRRIDLFEEPYAFPKDVFFRVDDWIPPQPIREMCLWSRAQVAEALHSLENCLAMQDSLPSS